MKKMVTIGIFLISMGYASDVLVDEEIIKNLEFFQNIEIVQNKELFIEKEMKKIVLHKEKTNDQSKDSENLQKQTESLK